MIRFYLIREKILFRAGVYDMLDMEKLWAL